MDKQEEYFPENNTSFADVKKWVAYTGTNIYEQSMWTVFLRWQKYIVSGNGYVVEWYFQTPLSNHIIAVAASFAVSKEYLGSITSGAACTYEHTYIYRKTKIDL